jgi:F-type H+-transporting ATPase subunit b
VTLAAFLAEAGLLDLSLSFVIEVVAFILMVLLLWFGIPPLRIPSAYRLLMDAVDARQRAIAEQLEAAEKAREEAEKRLEDARQRAEEARKQASEVVEAAGRSGEQLRAELRDKGEEERKRMVEQARREIQAARQQAVDSVREEVAGLVVAATEKVIGESLDGQKHKKLIDEAIREVSGGRRSS